MRILGGILSLSLAVTEGILLLEGRWQETLPLHLCSAAAIAALVLAWRKQQAALDFLWYLGIPGALLALVFPAPAVSGYQMLLTASYVITHGLIILIPAYALWQGRRIRRGRGRQMLLVLHAMAALALVVNLSLRTDYLFLMAPPYGTPLCAIYDSGYGLYLFALEGLACALLAVTGWAAPKLCPKLFLPSQRLILYKSE